MNIIKQNQTDKAYYRSLHHKQEPIPTIHQ